MGSLFRSAAGDSRFMPCTPYAPMLYLNSCVAAVAMVERGRETCRKDVSLLARARTRIGVITSCSLAVCAQICRSSTGCPWTCRAVGDCSSHLLSPHADTPQKATPHSQSQRRLKQFILFPKNMLNGHARMPWRWGSSV